MKPIAEVAMLTTQHGDTYEKCTGCVICDRIQQLRADIDRAPEDRFKNILEKGMDMSTEDIKSLAKNGVPLRTIRQYMKMTNHGFSLLINDLNLSKRNPKLKEIDDMAALTKEQLIEYTNAGMSIDEIAEKAGVKRQTVYVMRNKYGLSGKTKKADKTQKTQYEQAKKEVAAAIAINPELTVKLNARISELESQLLAEKKKREEAEVKVNNMEAAAEDLEKENAENIKKIKTQENILKLNEIAYNRMDEEVNNLAVEVDEWRERAKSYAQDNELMNSTNKQLRSMMEDLNRKVVKYAAALKEAL